MATPRRCRRMANCFSRRGFISTTEKRYWPDNGISPRARSSMSFQLPLRATMAGRPYFRPTERKFTQRVMMEPSLGCGIQTSLEREPVVLEGKTDSIEVSVFLCGRNSSVLSATEMELTKLRDLATGKVARTFQGHVGILSPDGKRVITGPPTDNFDNRIRSTKVDFKQQTRLWDVASGKELSISASGSPLCISPDGK